MWWLSGDSWGHWALEQLPARPVSLEGPGPAASWSFICCLDTRAVYLQASAAFPLTPVTWLWSLGHEAPWEVLGMGERR